MLEIYLPKYTSKEKYGGYSVYPYSTIASIERTLGHIWLMKMLFVTSYISGTKRKWKLSTKEINSNSFYLFL